MQADVKLAIECKRDVYLVNRLGGNLITQEQVYQKIVGISS